MTSVGPKADQGNVATLYTIKGSGWSVRTLWAVNVAQYPFERKGFPLLPWEKALITFRYGLKGNVSAPLLIKPDGTALTDSWNIVVEANGLETLFKKQDEARAREWHDLSNEILCYGRACMIETTDNDDKYLLEFLPPFLRSVPAIGIPIAKFYFQKFKDRYAEETKNASKDRVVEILQKMRQTLKDEGGNYLLGDSFSYADIAAVSGTHFLIPLKQPSAEQVPGVGEIPESQTCGLASEFADVLEWREGILAKHYPKKTP